MGRREAAGPTSGWEKLEGAAQESYWPLSYIDVVNGVRVAGEEEMNKALGEAAREAGIRWDRTKDWRGRKGKHLEFIIGDQRRHQKYRSQQRKAAWEVVKRLSRLKPLGKRKIVIQQMLPS